MTIAADLATALDPVHLAREMGMDLDPWQAKVMRSPAKRLLLNCCRQAGKSTVTALLAVHTAFYVPGSLTLLLSPSLRQSQELFRKCLAIYRAQGRRVATEAESTLRLELDSGSRIVSLPGKEHTVRGFSGVTLLAIDEAARVPDELYSRYGPCLRSPAGA